MSSEVYEEKMEQSEGFDENVEKGINEALASLKERYEDREDESENLPFHNVEHTKGVMRRTEDILRAIREADDSLVSERDIEIGRFASAYHDTVQRYEENEVTETEGDFKGLTKVLRKRFVGDNEKMSSGEAIEFMQKANEDDIIFSGEDQEVVRRSIDTTVPGWDPVNKTVMQPNLEKETSLVARALALSDIGVAGIDGPEKFTSEGKALFREENLDILEAIRSGDDIPEDKQKYFKQRMVGWLKSQAGFAKGRQARLEAELSAIPESARESVASLFDKFDESIEKSKEVADEAEKMSFEELVQYMGY